MEPFVSQVSTLFATYTPRIVGALVILVVAWLLAAVVRFAIRRAGSAAKLDARLRRGQPVQPGAASPTATLAEIGGWVVWLFALPPLLDTLALPGLLTPIQTMLNQFLGFLPNLLAAGILGAIAFFAARIVRRVVAGLLTAAGADRLGQRAGVAQTGTSLSNVGGTVAAVFVAIPLAIAALNALKLDAVTQPASAMLNSILNAIPNLFVAALILGVAFFVGRIIANVVAELLAGIGFNTLPVRLGIANTSFAGRTPAQLAGAAVYGVLVALALVQALQVIGFVALTAIVLQVLALLAHIAVGLVIFAIGLWVAHGAAGLVRSSGVAQAELLATATRVAVLVLVGAMALQQMGLANEIILLAFGLSLGAVAVATAVAFGLGGRESAARIVEGWRQQIQPDTHTNLVSGQVPPLETAVGFRPSRITLKAGPPTKVE